jgi:putative membrane protein
MMHGFGFGIGGLLGMVLIWILLIAGAVWLIKQIFSGSANQPDRKPGSDERAIDILNERYAHGELNRDEYEQMKNDLQG